MSYEIFYWVHVVSYISWLLAFVASLFFAYKAGQAFNTSAETTYMQRERKATSIGAHLGALGILISGGAMASIPSGPQWGWFSSFNWLGVKQGLFLLILVLVGFSIKKSVSFKKALRQNDGVLTTEIRQKWKSAYNFSLVIYMMVVFNTYLGLWEPF